MPTDPRRMTERDWLREAEKRHEIDSSDTRFWREHWNHTLVVRGKLKFTGSYDACLIAREAYRTEPYEIRDCTGRAQVTNR